METNKEGKKSNIGVASCVIGFIMLASFLYKKLNQPTKQDVKNQINVPSVNPTYDLDPKPAAYNNFGSGNRLNPFKVDVDFPEININEYLESKPKNFEMHKYNYDKDILKDYPMYSNPENFEMHKYNIDKGNLKDYLESNPGAIIPPENFEMPKYNMNKDILKDRSNKLNAGFQKILDTL